VYSNKEQKLRFSLLLKFAAATGAQPISLINATVQVADKNAGSVTQDQAIRFYNPNKEDTANKGSSKITGLETGELPLKEKLMSVLFKHVTIMLIQVEGRPTLVMYLTLIHTKEENRKPQPYVSKGSSLSRLRADDF
jgi:limonene-1,2-epoxide hydrolase